MDQARGFEKEKLLLKHEFISGSFWIWEYFAKAAAYYFIINYIKKQKELRKAGEERLAQERVLHAKEINEEKARRLQQEYERKESTFINLVHETKTPITLIDNYISEHIQKNGSSLELDNVKAAVAKLSRDINNLFDLERFERGIEMFNHQQIVDFSELLSDTYNAFVPYCRSRNLKLTSSIQENVYTAADPSALTRIINNLLENSIKYSEQDSTISLTLSADDHSILLSIEDEGIGFDDEDVDKVFTPYYQLNKTKKNIQGMGLGLPLVNSIVKELKGDISIVNKRRHQQKGAILKVVFNRAPKATILSDFKISASDIHIENIPDLTDVYRGEAFANILIVEDNKLLCGYMLTQLGKKFNVRYALNGKKALDRLETEVPDLIISDVMMDDMDGFELAKNLQSSPNYAHLPIIFLTARTTDVDKLKGLSLGAIDYMEKPFVAEELLKKAETILAYTDKRDQKLFDDVYEAVKALRKRPPVQKQVQSTVESENAFEITCRQYGLTTREIEITKLLLEGKSSRSIAETKFIAQRTVTTHIQNIYDKLQVANKVELINKLQ